MQTIETNNTNAQAQILNTQMYDVTKKKKQLVKTRMDRKIKKERQRNAGEQLE